MYCGKCGKKNPDEHQFCDKCGAVLITGTQKSDDNTGVSDKRRLIVGGLVAVVVIIVCIIAIGANTGGKVSPEYNEKIAEADRYLEELDYAKAETAYLEAIEIEPKVDDAYLKLADTYVVQEKYEEAVEILEKGQENAGGKEIVAMLEKVTPYDSYYDFLEAEVIPDVGLAVVDESFYWGENGGLVSALIQDINADEIPELITVTYGNTKQSTITMSVYTSSDGEVTLVDEYVEQSIGDEGSVGRQYNVILKEHEGKTYLCIYGYLAHDLSGSERFIRTYSIAEDEILSVCEVIYFTVLEGSVYSLNGDVIAEYDNEAASGVIDNSEVAAVADKAYDMFTEALIPFGLDGKLVKNEYGTFDIYGYDSEDVTETLLSYLQAGEFDEGNGVIFYGRDQRFLSDYTDLRNKLKQ